MHVSSKDSSPSGNAHVLTSIIEADGPFELVKPEQVLAMTPLTVTRTPSGGIEVSVRIDILDAPPKEEAVDPA
jgi:hypothetical protein